MSATSSPRILPPGHGIALLGNAVALRSYDPNTRAGRDALEAHRDAALAARLHARMHGHPAPTATATAEGRADLVLGWGGYFARLVKLDRGNVSATIELLKHRTGLAHGIARYLARGWSVGVIGSMVAGVSAHQGALYVLAGERALEPEDEDLAIEEGNECLALAFASRAFGGLDFRAPCSFAQLVALLADEPGWQLGLLSSARPARVRHLMRPARFDDDGAAPECKEFRLTKTAPVRPANRREPPPECRSFV